MKFIKLTKFLTVDLKDISYVNNDFDKYEVTIKFKGRYNSLTWSFKTSQDADSFYNTITDIIINESNSSNGGK